MKHFIHLSDWSKADIRHMLDLASEMKKGRPAPVDFSNLSYGLLFFNPSLRTRVSSMRAIEQMGGTAIALNVGDDSWSMVTEMGTTMNSTGTEHIKEAIPVLGRYFNFLGVRCFGDMSNFENSRKDTLIRSVASLSTIPVINLESSMAHPCQALADMMTIEEHNRQKQLKRPKVTISWTPHPKAVPMAVTNSFLLQATRMGWDICLARPEGYELDADVIAKAQIFSTKAGGSFKETSDQNDAFNGANVIYAKSWGSINGYSKPDEEQKRKATLGHWIISRDIMGKTQDGIFMHCLPVRRNVEVTDDVLDSKASVVIDQAENRLHTHKAILCHLHQINERKDLR
ncbi:MAG: N-acetylornithine carbamoyltransferase [Bdellovibrionales bacterium]|nr:N-acetylornithine carbamoyltransferase [Bdellovibrionales bacterium]